MIVSETALAKHLKMENLARLPKNRPAIKKVLKLAKDGELSGPLVVKLADDIPGMAKAFGRMISRLTGYGRSIQATKRLRWKVLRELAKTGRMSGKEILEALRLIVKAEKRDPKPESFWMPILTFGAVIVGGAVLTYAVMKQQK
ncbi:MAG: hypothetical protein E4H01_05405 [Lysobacterales bacterium]|nr:MAG: hypothetical protein E4H01_05405 [Xanthomonadales bacterium]